MKKRCLLLVAVAILAVNGFSQKNGVSPKWETIRHSEPIASSQTKALTDNSFVFGYSTDNIAMSLGFGVGATLRVAFLIPKDYAAKFTGAQITKIHVGFGSSPATNTSVFIAEGLENTTVPYSQAANLDVLKWNVVDLTTPYTITGTKDVFVGYEFTGGGTNEFYSIGLDDSAEPEVNANYFSVKENGVYTAWANFTDYGFYNVALKATIQGDNLPQYDLSVNSVKTSSLDVFPDEPFSILTSVKNQAAQTITSIKFVYELGDTTIQKVVSGISIAPFKNYTVSSNVSLSDEGLYPVSVTAQEINGETDEDLTNNSASTSQQLWVGNSVPTISRNRNVVLEEFTGIYCQYCPDGHKLANELKASNPGQVEIINVHQGPFANPSSGDPDFTTSWGNALATQTGLVGYPSGTVNRHVFSGNAIALNRGDWKQAAKIILNQASPINLLANTNIDWNTRTLTVDIDGYYTDNSASSTNLLNVALLQENILGPQTGASSLYPEMLTENGLYRHNHMLRHLLTGQWGDTIYTTTQGSSFSKQYTYTIPEAINGVPVDLSNLTVVSFIAEGKKEIITGTTSKFQHTLYTNPSIQLISLSQKNHQTDDNEILVEAVVQNISEETISSYSLQYGITNAPVSDIEVTGKNLLSLDKDTILLPLISIALKEEKVLNVSVKQVNNEISAIASQLSLKVKKDLSFANSLSLVLNIWQDQYGSETTWALFGPDQEIVFSGGPYSNLTAAGTKLHTENLDVLQNGVYRFEIYDAFGDGINSGAGVGKYEIRTSDNTLVTSDNGKFGFKGIKYLSVTDGTSINSISKADIAIYSIEDNLHVISSSPIAYIAVYDVFGKQVILQNKVHDFISLKELPRGVYIVKALTQTGEEKVAKINK
jgi:hypothetical protein